MRNRQSYLLALCLLIPVFNGMSTGALAQEDNPAVGQRASIEEVIVTARRRAENIQETPIAVSAFSDQDLRNRGIVNVQDLAKAVPSLTIDKSRSTLITIRGVGDPAGFARVDPTVGVYLDNLFLPRADGQLLDTVDIDSIQVLRGPQGTLFGKNTTGGAMVLTLKKPSDEREGFFEATAGSRGLVSIKGGMNFPISDRFFARLAANVIQDDGYIEDAVISKNGGSNNRQSLILQTRMDVTDTLLWDTLTFYGRVDEQIATENCNVLNENALFTGGINLMWSGDTDPTNPHAYADNCRANGRSVTGDYKTNIGPNAYMTRDQSTVMFGSTLEWSVSESLVFKGVLGLQGAEKGPQYLGDNDGGPEKFSEAYAVNLLDPDERNKRSSVSLEIQLNGEAFDERLNYTIGFFGMRETNEEPFTLFSALTGLDAQTLVALAQGQAPEPLLFGSEPLVGTLSPVQSTHFELENKAVAVFSQASYSLTEQMEVTLGLRYTAETRAAKMEVASSDLAAIESTLVGSGLFGPGAQGLHPFLANSWLLDPVRLANDLFPDINGDGIPDIPLDSANQQRDEREETFSKTTPMASLNYQVPNEFLDNTVLNTAMVYTTWSIGFKSGFFERQGSDGLIRVEPETVENLEVGFKIDAFERSLRLNMAFYDMKFDEMQLIGVKTDSNNALAVIFQNAAGSSIRGGEMELTWLPSQDVMFNLSYSNNNYSYENYQDRDLFQTILGNDQINDRSGEGFIRAPEEQLSMGLQVSFDTPVGIITPRLDARYFDERYFGVDAEAWRVFKQDPNLAGDEARVVADFRCTWQNDIGDTTLTAYVNNLTNEDYKGNGGAIGESVATHTGQLSPPRSYGIGLRKTF